MNSVILYHNLVNGCLHDLQYNYLLYPELLHVLHALVQYSDSQGRLYIISASMVPLHNYIDVINVRTYYENQNEKER